LRAFFLNVALWVALRGCWAVLDRLVVTTTLEPSLLTSTALALARPGGKAVTGRGGGSVEGGEGYPSGR
jgi:hypothetical protein